jgi:hypothetical protein
MYIYSRTFNWNAVKGSIVFSIYATHLHLKQALLVGVESPAGPGGRAGVQIYRISESIPVKQVFLTKPRPFLTVNLLTANPIRKALNLL